MCKVKNVFKSEKELISFLRAKGDMEYNSASDDYILQEAYEQGLYEINDGSLYPRSCDNCGKGMDSGYIIGGNTYCDRNDSECRKTIFSDKEWDEHYDDEGDDCWTTWELEDDINYTISGHEVEMAKCCSEISKNEFEQHLEWIDGSPTDSETWKCKVCDKEWEVPCYIVREWEDVESQS